MPRVEYVQVDKGGAAAHSGGVPPVCAALRQAREEAGITQEDLAKRIGRAQSSIQKWEAGREPKLDRIAALEYAMGYQLGHVLRLAGYVSEPKTVRSAIEADRALLPEARSALLDFYDSGVKRSAERRASRAAAASPATDKTQRR